MSQEAGHNLAAVSRALGVCVIAALGLWWSANPLLLALWGIWTSDGLRSIGLLIVPTSLFFCLRAWRGGVSTRGTWWGLLVCAAAMIGAQISSTSVASYHVAGLSGAGLRILPIGLVLWAYVSGVVLLFFGTEGWRKAAFPLAFLLLVNPVPEVFQRAVDLPLQYVAAATARSFAAWLHTPLHSDQLKLMFSPSLGMFVAPGCNGLRGAVAMGYLTLSLGYLRGLPFAAHSIYVLAGIFVAYLFNLIRLCSLVLCYRVALGFSFLGDHMEAADYVIGGVLFLCAASVLFGFPKVLARRFSQ